MLNENEITDILEVYFELNNYTVIQKRHTGQRGVDLIVQDPLGAKHYIEVKGETSSKEYTRRYGHPFDKKQIWNHVSVALLKTIKTIIETESDDNKFGMAFPENHEPLLLKMLPVLKKLDLSIYIVSRNGVKLMQP